MKYIKLLLILFCFIALSCEKLAEPLPDTLPPYTQEGRGVVACKINNQIWVSGGKLLPTLMSSYPNPRTELVNILVEPIKTVLYVSAYRYAEPFTDHLLGFNIKDFKGGGLSRLKLLFWK